MFAKNISTEAFKKLTFGDSLINIYEAGHLTDIEFCLCPLHSLFFTVVPPPPSSVALLD